jgi:Domain of unknown function (DUF4259)
MGAWEASAFGNDAAMDWVAELERRGVTAVTAALTAAVEVEEYLEAPVAEEAVASAEVVATALGQPAPDLPGAVQVWVQNNPAALSADDAELALRAVDRVNCDASGLYELWVDDAEDADWSASIADLRRRLEQVITRGP